jgi:hypothetical protein
MLEACIRWLDPVSSAQLQNLLSACSTGDQSTTSSEVLVAVQWPPASSQQPPVPQVLRMAIACWPPLDQEREVVELWHPGRQLCGMERVLLIQHLPCAVAPAPPLLLNQPQPGTNLDKTPAYPRSSPDTTKTPGASLLPSAPACGITGARARRASAPLAMAHAAAVAAAAQGPDTDRTAPGAHRTSRNRSNRLVLDALEQGPSWAAAIQVADALSGEPADRDRERALGLCQTLRKRRPSHALSVASAKDHGLQALDSLAIDSAPFIITLIDVGPPGCQASVDGVPWVEGGGAHFVLPAVSCCGQSGAN